MESNGRLTVHREVNKVLDLAYKLHIAFGQSDSSPSNG